MILIENAETFGWEAAIRGMRNPLDSWDRSDSTFIRGNAAEIGPNDLGLMMKLAKAGTEHSKYRRMVNVTCDVTAPLYWWKEFDTYKVGTVANSCSTMHKIHSRDLTLADFSHEHLNYMSRMALSESIAEINRCREAYGETKNKSWWWQMIQLLPSSYNQRRTVQLNYEVLSAMYRQRKSHKLDEWRDFCEWVESLPFSGVITLSEGR